MYHKFMVLSLANLKLYPLKSGFSCKSLAVKCAPRPPATTLKPVSSNKCMCGLVTELTVSVRGLIKLNVLVMFQVAAQNHSDTLCSNLII